MSMIRLAIYAARVAWSAFTFNSAGSVPDWARWWWRDDQSQNRDDSWT